MRGACRLVALGLLAGCAVKRPVAQPLSEARYYHAEDALAKAGDRLAARILERLPREGPIVVALPASGGERQNRLVRSLVFAGLAAGRDLRVVPHAAAHAQGAAPVLEVVTLAAGPELLADPPPEGNRACSFLHVAVLARVHRERKLLWSEILWENERELRLEVEKS